MSQHSLFAWCTGALRDSARMLGLLADVPETERRPWWTPSPPDVMACIERVGSPALWFCVLHERYPGCVEPVLRPYRKPVAA